jgi:hypothetical protein
MQYLKPNWAYWIAEQYPQFVKSISDCQKKGIKMKPKINNYNMKMVKV